MIRGFVVGMVAVSAVIILGTIASFCLSVLGDYGHYNRLIHWIYYDAPSTPFPYTSEWQ